MDVATSLVLLTAVIAASAAFVYMLRLHHQRSLRINEMLHEERMAAINQGLELPPHGELDSASERSATPRAALGAGLVLVLGGVGLNVAFRFVPTLGDGATGLHTLSSLGVIPVFVGVGLLIFAWATRALSR